MPLSHILLAVLVTFIWGVNFTFIVWGLESFPPLMLTALRFLFTAFPLMLFVKPPKFNRTLVVYAVGTFVIQYAFVFTAMHLGATAGLTGLLLQLQIFITVVLAYFMLGEAVSKKQIFGMVIGLLGLGVIAINLGGDMPVMAFVCILIAAVGWSFGNIASKQASGQASTQASEQASKQASEPVSKLVSSNALNQTQSNTPTLTTSTATSFIKPQQKILSALSQVVWGGLIACVILTILSLTFEFDAWTWATFANASLKSWLSLGFIVYVSTLIGFGLWTFLLAQNTASKVMPFALLVPVFGMATSMWLTGETLTWWKGLAMVLILSGLVLANVKIKRLNNATT